MKFSFLIPFSHLTILNAQNLTTVHEEKQIAEITFIKGRQGLEPSLLLSWPVHLTRNNTGRDVIAGFYKQTQKKGGARIRLNINRDLDAILT